MNEAAVKKVVIAGGGTAGWIAAATLASQLKPLIDITLVESDVIGTVGVGEATIPTHRSFHTLLGIDEQAFMRACQATFKLGIAFENWANIGDRYIHAFGSIGKSTWMADFQHMWHQARAEGGTDDLDDYCLELQAAEAGRFETSENGRLSHAYHLDASLYAQFLRQFSEKRGVTRVEGMISNVRLNAETGFIDGLDLDGGRSIDGDLFIDCTGFRGLLIGEALGVPYEDWSHLLPMDRAWAVQTESQDDIRPYTRAIALPAGWQWRIPLQHRVGNGHVFSSQYMDEEHARQLLMDNLDGAPVIEPRLIKFKTGRRTEIWSRNCIAFGLSSAFLEPLESTSIHLIQTAATRLIQLFPFSGVEPALTKHFNTHAEKELEGIRDFLILHYILTNRTDSDFWKDRARVPVPETLQHRINLYKQHALAYQEDLDLFRVASWLQVMRGQGLESEGYHRIGQMMPEGQLRRSLDSLKKNIRSAVDRMPMHKDFIKSYCAVPEK